MKICPTCNEEFENELEVCPNDETPLEEKAEEEAEAAEVVETAAEETGEEAPEDSEAPAEESEAEEASEEAEEAEAAAAAEPGRAVEAGSEGMSTLQKASIIVLVVLLVGAGLVFWKSKVGGHHDVDLTSMSAQEMQTLVKDFNPMQLKALAESPEQKKQLVDNIQQLLAIANQAKKEGIADEPAVKGELENMRITLLAMAYDKKINGDKGPMPPFGFIGEDRVREFWGEDGSEGSKPSADANSNTAPGADANTAANANTNSEAPKPAATAKPKKDQGFLVSALDVVGLGWMVGGADARRHEAEFKIFLDNKLALLRERGQFKADQEPSEDEIKQAKDAFAKTRIYYEEAEVKLNSMGSMPEAERKEWEEFKESYELQAKLQEAQFLVQTYVQDKLSKKLQVTDEEVTKYIADHPELTNTEEKKKKAEEVLKKVQAGGDFAELAKEYSEDPGSKDNGGLYENIAKGQFAPEFEAAALALEPGQVADKVIKTDFGYHIIKLEKKGEAKGADGKAAPTYDARHILISTLVKDPENPTARDMPVDQFVRQKLEKEKQEKILEEIKKNNPVNIAADFKVPEPSAEELEKIQKQQQEQLQQMLEQQKAAGEGEEKGPSEKK